MKEYMQKWKAEHSAIRSTLASVVELDIHSKAGQGKMRNIKSMILEHLKSEDEVLYPMLKKAARQNVNMTRVMEILAKEMDELAPKIEAFFTEYENDPKADGLSTEFGNISRLITARIDKEEAVLLKEYENIGS